MTYVLHLLVVLSVYGMLTASLNVVVGFTGLFSLAHAAFFGIGAYTSAILLVRADLGFPAATLAGAVIAAGAGVVAALPALRLKGDYFLLASMTFQALAFSVMDNADTLTGGSLGFPGIPRPLVLGEPVGGVPAFLLLSASVCAVAVALLHVMLRSSFGLALRALRDDELAAKSLGMRVHAFKLVAFAMSAAVAAVAGSLYATYFSFVDPSSFDLSESVFLFAVLLVGGSGNLKGPLIGTATMVLLPEALRFLQLPDAVAANARRMVYGVLLVVLMRLRPQGLAGDYGLD